MSALISQRHFGNIFGFDPNLGYEIVSNRYNT